MIVQLIFCKPDELNSPHGGYLHLLRGSSMYLSDKSSIIDESMIVQWFFIFTFDPWKIYIQIIGRSLIMPIELPFILFVIFCYICWIFVFVNCDSVLNSYLCNLLILIYWNYFIIIYFAQLLIIFRTFISPELQDLA